jgi:CheY-like chemotaxis protein
VEIECAPFSLAAVIEESLEIVSPMAARQGLRLSYTIAEETPPVLVGDLARTRQVLVNLLGNAVKFTPAGEVRVSLSAHPVVAGRSVVHFAVSDTGIGIPREALGGLFRAFHQLDGSLARRYGGTGLGLAISKRLTELMGGEIWVESRVGEGSTFHFTIAGEVSDTPLFRPAVPGRAVRRLTRPLRVLLAEDRPVNQQVMLGMLEHLGYRADLASDGEEVLEALARQPYDVVLMDIQMPRMDGLETACRIRRQKAGCQPRVIALTAHAMSGDRERFLAAGMDGYLSKPVKMAELEAILAAHDPAPPAPAVREESVRELPKPAD